MQYRNPHAIALRVWVWSIKDIAYFSGEEMGFV